jgi:hypothetical protein
MRISFVIKSLLAVTAVSVPLLVHAESNVQTGAATATPGATAHVDFQITIPKVLFLRVGTGSTYATGNALTNVATVDLIQFAPAAGTVGNGTAVAGTGGDLGGGVVTAAIVSNSGTVTYGATNAGPISDGLGDTISYSNITTTAAKLTSATALAPPVLVDGTSTTQTLTPPASKFITADATWTYKLTNATTFNPPAGTYGGVATATGRVTYTATMP